MRGNDPLGLSDAANLFERLGDMDQLEQMLDSLPSPGALAEVDLDRVRQLLGPEEAASLEQLAELARRLEKAGLIEQREGRLELTPRGIRHIGRNALTELFARLSRDRLGRHEIVRTGLGRERAEDTKPYEFGDPFDLNIERTIRNAIVRQSGASAEVVRLPVRLQPDDFEVERTEDLTRTATVLMIDLSLSMPMRDNFLAAKKVAMALQSLISTQFPRDYLGLVGFSEVAREIEPNELPEVSWDFVYGTNMQHAFLLARKMLGRQSGTKQIIMITDGEPTAHLLADGTPYFNYPPIRATVDATLTEVARCTRAGIRINTFMIGDTVHLRDFVEQMTKLNRGRAFFTTPETLGDYVLVDFIEQRRAASGRSSGRSPGLRAAHGLAGGATGGSFRPGRNIRRRA
ncbi:MAG TPA: VWA domain-containing protein, partial [Acidimicrobiales bacterium]|nr:VWA domain-containing protein [Acidimicrobiales bacterium]